MNLTTAKLDISIEKFPKKIQELILNLNSKNLTNRLEARKEFVEMKSDALEFLKDLLKSDHEQLRWEVVKCIVEIHSTKSINLLLEIMNKDKESDVREVAARGLAKFGIQGLEPLLHRLIRGKGIIYLYETAAYPLRMQEDLIHSDHLHQLIDSLLESITLQEIVPTLATRVLNDIQKTKSNLS